ncbi:hypothetical protein [Rhizobium sp. SG570]|uniref:hypothetical protein n=1 Tax=Rhizobium sp. SG570 TaxID=2587113 RepID=UPI0017DE1684|nr:hypothetical protein [Rhizobium sp. SG570]NKJ36605.1 hypothetical protein [Rhizobium sp. SG570]
MSMSTVSIIGSGGMAAALGGLAVKSDFTGFLNPEDSFGAQEIAKVAPADAEVVKAFNTQNAGVLSTGPVEGHTLDVFIAGDDAQTKARVSAFIERVNKYPRMTLLV